MGLLDAIAKGFIASGAPEKTVKAYKLFRTNERRPGELFPLFVNADQPVPIGEWVNAEIGPQAASGKVRSRLGELAYRPGWHAGDMPVATHIGGKSDPGLTAPDYRPGGQVWAEVEMPDDYDWQTEALARAQRNARGEVIPRTAHITDQLPMGGHYRYKTNPNMTGEWLIGGSMRVNGVLDDEAVRTINARRGAADLPRLQTDPADFSRFDLLRRYGLLGPIGTGAGLLGAESSEPSLEDYLRSIGAY